MISKYFVHFIGSCYMYSECCDIVSLGVQGTEDELTRSNLNS